ncbi:hypothetical protein BUALT_Bualt02G0031100 [Buddleja alternifolia]|uniref:RNA methyltransferase n=1 Tax=Buddleja alternifolia TaxID=168488 RepID=A0AAV6Y7W3_9LAMI|nr:hypothetical protein BUALT_Bualt02G0031100 [Buddleja alternifolia]
MDDNNIMSLYSWTISILNAGICTCYQVGQDLEEDPRLKVMKREWFEGKDCLDIGCNSGLITIAIAKKFGCRSILGVDIDGVVKTSTHKTTCRIAQSADAELVNGLETPATETQTEVTWDGSGDSPLLETKDLLTIVSFQKGNFIQNWRPPANTRYHAILCLSVSKWIHLNWGDDGLITLFSRVWTLLHPTAAANYKNIEISPEDFQDVLLDKIGFRSVENITASLSGTKSGFDRPILAFWK